MSLPRNARAKNRQAHLKNDSVREVTKKLSELDNICHRHKVGDLTFRSCKFSTAEGVINYVDYDQIRGNLRSSIMIVKAKSIDTNTDTVYDIVKIKNEKLERDRIKKLEEEEKALAEIERLKNNKEKVESEHTELLEKLQPESVTTNEDTETTVENVSDTNNTDSNVDKMENNDSNVDKTETVNNNSEPTKDPEPEKKKKLSRREKALRQLRNQLAKKNKPAGNKYYRNFMRDLKSKFVLTSLPEITYVEVKADASDMVVADVGAYQINMPNKVIEKYYLFIGDLQMKSGLIRTIDPAFDSDKMIDEQTEFLERIKAKEKTVSYDDDILESDSDSEISTDDTDENSSSLPNESENNQPTE